MAVVKKTVNVGCDRTFDPLMTSYCYKKRRPVNKFVFIIALMCVAGVTKAQKVDSIYFHLYTDSLKKGQYNYINVDGKLANGSWMPLSEKEVLFTCNEAEFKGNELIIPDNFKHDKVRVKAVLKSNPAVWKEVTIWIKKLPDPKLPTRDDVMRGRN